MTSNERIRELRKTLHLTMEEFGQRLGVGKTAISKIENGDRSLTEQMFLAICREYNVRPEWLRNGTGEPFIVPSRNDQISAFIGRVLANEPDGPKARLIAALSELDQDGWDVLVDLARKMVEEQAND